jgi:two-component system LytT family response regulator
MSKLRCYLVDDEELSLSTLRRMLTGSGRADVVGHSTDPAVAIEEIQQLGPEVLFLDIHMPEIDGFELLSRLSPQPYVIFTTAYEQHALRAFESNSVDYLLKPIEDERLQRALDKLERRTVHGDSNATLRLDEALMRLAEILKPKAWLSRIACETGRGVSLVDVQRISHFVSEDRHSYACAETGRFLVNRSLSELETRLDPACFLRIHRSAIVNLHFVDQISGWFAGRIHVKLRNSARTELTVSRTSVDKLRGALGM